MNHPSHRISLPGIAALAAGTAAYFLVPWSATDVTAHAGALYLFAWTILLPGWALTRLLGQEQGDTLAAIGLWVMHGLAVALGCAFIWAVAGTTASVFRVLVGVVAPILALTALVRGITSAHASGEEAPRALRLLVAGVLIFVCVSVYLGGAPVTFQTDTIDYIAYANEIAETGEAFPITEFYKDAGTDGEDLRKGLLHALYGSWKAQLGLNTVALFSLLAALLLAAATLMVYAAARHMLQDGMAAVVAAILFLLCYEGGISTDLIRTWFYPSRFGVAPLLMFTAAAIALYRRPSAARVLVCCLGAFTVAAVHIQYTVLSGIVVILILMWKACAPAAGWSHHIRRSALVGAVALAGMLPYGVFRYLTAYQSSDLHTQVQGAVFIFGDWFMVDPAAAWKTTGPLLAAAVVAIIPLWRAKRDRAGVGFAIAAVLSVLFVQYNPFVLTVVYKFVTYLVYRLGQVTAYFLLPAYLVAQVSRRQLSPRRVPVAMALLLTAAAVGLSLANMPTGLAWTEAEQRRAQEGTHRRWAQGLKDLSERLPAGSVILSDPVTSYTISAFTPHYVVCTLDQHAPPNDRYALDRIAAARDILSPFTSAAQKVAGIKGTGATHVVVNENVPPRLILDSWTMDPTIAALSRRSFERWPGVFQRVALSDSLTLFKLAGPVPREVEPVGPSFLVAEMPANARRVGRTAGQANLSGAAVSPLGIERGGTAQIDLYWTPSQARPPAKYVVFIRMDCEGLTLPLGGRPFPKLARKFREAVDGVRYRARAEHMIAHGFFGPDSWPQGALVRDSVALTIPTDLAPGRYTLRATMLAVAHAPNHRLRDFFFDDDVYHGVEIGHIMVK